jgi:hypothetical protein
MIFRKYSEFMDMQRIDENLKAARKYLGVSTKQAIEQDIDKKNQEIRQKTKDTDFEGAKAARAEKLALEEQLAKVDILDKIVAMLGPSRQAWIYSFVKFYYDCFEDSMYDTQRIESLKEVLADLGELDKKHLLGELPMIKANPGAGLANYADVVASDDTPENKRNGLERLIDDIRDTMVLLTVNKFISELPGQFTVKNPQAKDFGVTVPSFKEAARKSAGRLKDQIREIAIAFDELSENPKDKQALQKIFFWGCKRYRTINEVVSKAYEYIKSSGVGDVAALRLKIYEACEKYGMNNGAEIVYDEGGICVFEVKSFQANVLINAKTKHCIKDSYSQWESYVSADRLYNKQYYIWDFNVNPAAKEHIIGLTVEPAYKIRAAHFKGDEAVHDIKAYVRKNLKINFEEVFLPMTDGEIEVKKKRVEANKVIVDEKLTIEKATKAIEDGADPNTRDGKPLMNAVTADKVELVEYLIKAGAKPTIGRPMDHAKSLKVIALLHKNGCEITDNVISNCINDADAVKYLIEEGNLDPNGPYDGGQPSGMPVRAAIRAGALESLKLMIAAGGEVHYRRNLGLRQAFVHGHLDVARYIIDHMKSKKLTISKDNADEIIESAETSSKVRDAGKRKKVISDAVKMLAEITA